MTEDLTTENEKLKKLVSWTVGEKKKVEEELEKLKILLLNTH
jgi:hypothetical protein